MAPHPTIIHAAADLRRQAFLAEANDALRVMPPDGKTTRLRRERTIRRLVDQAASLCGRLVDDFEPLAAPLSWDGEGRRVN